MFSTSSTIVFIVFAVRFIYVARRIHGEENPVYNAIGTCMQKGWKGVGMDIQKNGGHVKNGAGKVEELCIFFRVR